jgi:hypothetical protein
MLRPLVRRDANRHVMGDLGQARRRKRRHKVVKLKSRTPEPPTVDSTGTNGFDVDAEGSKD